MDETQEATVAVWEEIVAHVAQLAHVGIEQAEAQQLAAELGSVLHHIDRLQRVDTEQIPPTAFAVSMENVMREDAVVPSWPPAAVLANAPRRQDDQFEVQAVLE